MSPSRIQFAKLWRDWVQRMLRTHVMPKLYNLARFASGGKGQGLPVPQL